MGTHPHSITIQDFIQARGSAEAPGVFDVRKEPAFRESGRMMPGARWRHPFAVDGWAADATDTGPVIVYCVHGHEVSQGVAAYLRARGIDARFLEGGFEGYVEAGGETVAA